MVQLQAEARAPLANKVLPMAKFSHVQPPAPKLAGEMRDIEAMLVEDILYILMGCEGNYIRFSDSYDPNSRLDRLKGPAFRVTRNMDPSLMDLTMSITEIAKHYVALDAFIEYQGAPTFGSVNQALCASIRKILKEYLLLISQLESQMLFEPEFTLHRLNVQLLPMANMLRHTFHLAQAILHENDRKREQAKNTLDIDELLESVKDHHNFRFLDSFSSSSRVCKGGSLLRLLSLRLEKYAGDPTAKTLLTRILRDSSKPYLRMLEQWTHKGIIDDPYDEFLVIQTETVDTDQLDLDFVDEYWDRRYQIRKHDLPLEFSNPEVYEKILLTGKYLNIIRECGGSDISTDIQQQFSSIDDPRIPIIITRAYHHANESLLRLLVDNHDLSSWMNSLKHYFFLNQADFFLNFLESANTELSKPLQEASVAKIQYLLDMALRQPGTISAEDPFKDDVLVQLNSETLIEQLTDIVEVTGINPEQLKQLSQKSTNSVSRLLQIRGSKDGAENSGKKPKKQMQALTGLEFDFKIPFPVSLVLSQNSLIRYKILFRNLVELKSVESKLTETWIEQTKSKIWCHKSDNHRLTEWKNNACRTRSFMCMVIQSILYYCTIEVLEPNWSKLEKSLKNSNSVDILRNSHVGCLDTCLKECMLLTPNLFTRLERVTRSCRIYSQFMIDAERAILLADPKAIPDQYFEAYLSKLPRLSDIPDSADDQMQFLEHYFQKINNSFNQGLNSFVKNLNYYASTESTALMNLLGGLELIGLESIKPQ